MIARTGLQTMQLTHRGLEMLRHTAAAENLLVILSRALHNILSIQLATNIWANMLCKEMNQRSSLEVVI